MIPTDKMANTAEAGIPTIVPYDRWLLGATIALITMGLLMVASASIVISDQAYQNPFHYTIHQASYLLGGLILAWLVIRTELTVWQRLGPSLLIVSIGLLALVLIHGIGREINGSMRWIGVGPIGLQVSELAKLSVIIYLAGYLVRRDIEIRTRLSGFLKPMAVLGVVALLLLREPDFGAATVIMATALAMMFLAGVRLWQFLVLFAIVAGGLALLAVSSPYRMARLTSFLNPWANQYNSGYQLTQSLIAFGRGGWFGVGLGESLQKLFYLPEAHTDFLFAVLAEELGLFGIIIIIGLFMLLVGRGLFIGYKAHRHGRYFAAYLAYGLALWLGFQALINIGVNAGILPTKGLTLPLMSYGGSSMLMNCIAIALLLRVDYELRRHGPTHIFTAPPDKPYFSSRQSDVPSPTRLYQPRNGPS